jgi:hypothetical protein
MSKVQIESITYERERLDFFTELMKLAQTRYNLLHRRFKDAPYLSEAHQTLSDMGREIHFFGDVVDMLEKGYSKQSEGEWIDKPTGAYGRMQSWCSACGKHSGIGGIESNRHKPFCPNCGAKMKGVWYGKIP